MPFLPTTCTLAYYLTPGTSFWTCRMLQLFTHLQNALFPFIDTSLQQLKAENTCETLAAIFTEQSCHLKRQVYITRT